jgi:glycosyltransferase involved in cell wall biosynthesis
MNNFFTVIVPNLNHGEYLSDCLNSILKQNYKKFEIIILDGGSSDDSLKIIKKFAQKNKFITYWRSKKDGGQANAINLGIKLAKGNWITWQNSDDLFSSSDALNLMNKNINLNPEKKLFVGNMNLISKSNKIIKKLKYIKPNFSSLLYEGMTLSNQCSFWHKSLTKNLGYLKNYDVDFDYEWYLRILYNYPNCGFHINKTIASFRIHKNQKTSKKNTYQIDRIKKIKLSYGKSDNFFLNFIFKYFLLIKRTAYYLSINEFSYVFFGFSKKIFSLFNKKI